MGSRYGGLKQIDPLNEDGDMIIDFSLYDAMRAGFKKAVFIIRREHEADFRHFIGDKVKGYIDVDYAYQDIDFMTDGFRIPEQRVKPWGTGHAVLSAADKLDGPFAIVNADDFYGRQSFKLIYDYLNTHIDDEFYRYAMVGYPIENTISENGYVSRGICKTNARDMLVSVTERTHIEKTASGQGYEDEDGEMVEIKSGTLVSMNMWGFSYSMIDELRKRFPVFLKKALIQDPMKAEFFLPSVVSELLEEDLATVKVMKTTEKWYGMTYKEDKETVRDAVAKMKEQGIYPEHLWK
ncbi:MAG: nucleotidyltransferase [Lachnospiraceae bacterium]|nr:nucleotidyltransferase [Lachnospiraceae bacterium]